MHAHLRLPLVDQSGADSERDHPWSRRAVVALGAIAAALFTGSFFLPWWKFWLYAPQYPKGLRLVIGLTGMSGDVHEIDLLNHYIGMKHLADAAPLERHLAGWGVALIALVTVALASIAGKKLNRLVAIPALTFPIIFLADSFYWLYSFGHSLDPKAPLRIAPFTPQLFGNGSIGQFDTFAQPALGFWIAVLGVACMIASTLVRTRVCASCPRAKTCRFVCSKKMVLS